MFPHLAQPIKIGKLELTNRLTVAPMAHDIATPHPQGYVTQRLLDAYRAKGRGGWGLVMVEATQVSRTYTQFNRMLHISDNSQIGGLAELAAAVKEGGSKVGIQIQHPGWMAPASWNKLQPVAPSNIGLVDLLTREPVVPRPLTAEEVEESIEEFAAAARRAKMAGFDLVGLHAAHGFLIHEFMSPRFNKRDDKWGEPSAFVIEVVKRVRKAIGPDYPLSIRISGAEYMGEGDASLELMLKMAPLLVEAGVDCIDVSAGNTIGSHAWLSQPIYFPRGCIVHLAEAMKKVVSVPVVTAGRINDPILAETIVARGRADIVSFGRGSFADPELARKALEGRVDEIRKCTACELCAIGTEEICAVNYDLGKPKSDCELRPADPPKKVMIIGGGVGGMEAARVATLRKHHVTLYDRRPELGGAIAFVASAMPRLNTRDLKNIVDWQTTQLKKLGVRLELGKEVTPELVEKEKPDVVIVATGSRPRIPKIPGIDKKNVVLLDDYLAKKLEVGQKVVVLGGHYGVEVAISLVREGKEVTIVEEAAAIAQAPYLSPVRQEALFYLIQEIKLQVLTGTRVKEITDSGVVVIGKEGKERSIEADTVLIALDRLPEDTLAQQLKGKVPEVYEIGDCVRPSHMRNAIHSAGRKSREI
jgi:2,4-dienoyl-CoA reductase-like NADH-dependent reductase (Old Yellow Enzyme family)/thioredoxin reductase